MKKLIQQPRCYGCGSILNEFIGLFDLEEQLDIILRCSVCGFVWPLTLFKKDLKKEKKDQTYLG